MAIELEQGRRVRLLEALDDGEYQPGDTGYLNCWISDGITRACSDDSWGVVFDKNGDDGHTVVRGTRTDGSIALLVDVVECIQIVADDADDNLYACIWAADVPVPFVLSDSGRAILAAEL